MTPEGVAALCRENPGMRAALKAVARHGPPGAWIGAGFLRNAVWDVLHGRRPDVAELADLDVVFLDAAHPDPAADEAWEARLREALPLPWSVTNQARMHGRSGQAAYCDLAEAIAHWPETATAVAARMAGGKVELLAPHGWTDLLRLLVRPTPAFEARREVVAQRAEAKGWRHRWPRLTFA
ncbi:nucleotidyltransferase family protein [Roseococcus sp. YIM B11640]|uniref:nucleotidyltransferase family protein n=1 Tax=Roseococcus sp. YIM B11640 TaxID=3133973 RepID=UPI003C7EB756